MNRGVFGNTPRLNQRSPLYIPEPRPGDYFTSCMATGANNGLALSSGDLAFLWVPIGTPVNVDRLGTAVSSGVASCTVTLGVYKYDDRLDRESTSTGELMVSGTIDASTTGQKEISVNLRLDPPGVMCAALVLGATSNLKYLSTVQPFTNRWYGGDYNILNLLGGVSVRQTGASALPVRLAKTGGLAANGQHPMIYFRRAAW